MNNLKLNSKQHAANKTLWMIKRNFEYINKDAFEVLYGTLVRPQLEYNVYNGHHVKLIWEKN